MRIITQVLDGAYGKPAAGVGVRLERAISDNGWTTVGEAETNDDGRVEDSDDWHLERGVYRIVFDSDSHFAKLGATTAYPVVIVIFRMQDESNNFQVQVTLAPCTYSTYFGTLDRISRNQEGDRR